LENHAVHTNGNDASRFELHFYDVLYSEHFSSSARWLTFLYGPPNFGQGALVVPRDEKSLYVLTPQTKFYKEQVIDKALSFPSSLISSLFSLGNSGGGDWRLY